MNRMKKKELIQRNITYKKLKIKKKEKEKKEKRKRTWLIAVGLRAQITYK